MEFSPKDLEDIQRVAGLLNLNFDQLIQQRRREAGGDHFAPSSSSITIPAPGSGPLGPLGIAGSSQAWHDGFHHASHASHAHTSFHDHSPVLDHGHPFGLEEYADREPSAPSATSDGAEGPGTEVILLNPQAVWYDCDAGLWDPDAASGDHPGTDEPMAMEEDGEESFVAVTPMQLDADTDIVSTPADATQEKDLESVGADWAMVSSSPGSFSSFHTPISPHVGSSTDKRYHPLAPRAVQRSPPHSGSQASSSSHKIRKKRSPYQGTKKKDTNLTRQVHACVRCRMQRNRCIPDPTNPRGPCLTCQQKTVRMSRLPCLRYMVTDSTLFRTGLDYMPFYRSHPMIGPNYGDFHLSRRWTSSTPKILCLGQLQGPMHLKVELREFVPPVHYTDVDLKGRPMYAMPWAIADPDAVVVALNNYIDRGVTQYLYEYLDDTNTLVWDIFQQAYRSSVFPIPNRMLQKTLRLWVACRFIESKWRCWAADGREDVDIRNIPKDPFHDWDSLPPYLDYQMASIIIQRVLSPLRKDVLRDLQATFNVHSPKDWYVTFLTAFILLQNYEMQMNFQNQFALRRQSKWQYLDMPLVRATNSGAKTILAHFHYCYKGQQLFTKDFDWHSNRVRRMARLDPEQTSFMSQCRDFVVDKGATFKAVNQSDNYHQVYWYTSQLFDSDWTPHETLEHAPPVETASPSPSPSSSSQQQQVA